MSDREKEISSARSKDKGGDHGSFRGFWVRNLWFGKETVGPIAIFCFGLVLLALGLSPTVNSYCLPNSKQELRYRTGQLLEISRNFRMGDSFVVQFEDGPRSFSTASYFADKLERFIGDEVVIGSIEGPFYCRSRALHIERSGEVIKDGDTSVQNRKNGRWFDVVAAITLSLLASMPLLAGYRLLRKKSSELHTLNKGAGL